MCFIFFATLVTAVFPESNFDAMRRVLKNRLRVLSSVGLTCNLFPILAAVRPQTIGGKEHTHSKASVV